MSVKKILISFCLFASWLPDTFAQEQRSSFTWLDRSEKRMAGIVTANIRPLTEAGLYQLGFSVTWYDQDGKAMTEAGRMPFLCLSNWDIERLPLPDVSCLSTEGKRNFNLIFQTTGELNIQILNGYRGDVELITRFKYALTREMHESGRSEKIELPDARDLKMVFQVNSGKPRIETDLTGGNRLQTTIGNTAALRRAENSYRAVRSSIEGYEDRKNAGEPDRSIYLQEIESLADRIRDERDLLNRDSIPPDSVISYRTRYNELNARITGLLIHLKSRISQDSPVAGPDPSLRVQQNDSLRNSIRYRIEPVLQQQVDSLALIATTQRSIAMEISTALAEAQTRNPAENRIDSLILSHGAIKKEFLQLQLSNDKVWGGYLNDIQGLMPVPEIERLHASFVREQNEMQSAIDQVDNNLAAILPQLLETPWYLTNRLLWSGLLAVMVIVFVSLIWSTSRNRKILREKLASIGWANLPGAAENGQVSAIQENEVPNEYFSIGYEDSIPDSVIGKVHYHTSAIKSVYNLIQSAVLERKGAGFGGYLFGNQYRLHGTGAARVEIFVEKVCDSACLRSYIPNETESRADLVDEMNKLVRQNSKYRLIGWFTSSPDASLEIPDGLLKIHRTFFREKWQIGLLINPASDALQGAGFMKRKSGFVDRMPDPAAFLKWDELYRFALNPGNSARFSSDGTDRTGKEYSRIDFNNTWADSVVSAVNFDIQVVTEIIAAAALHAIPKDTFQVVGYLYGTAAPVPGEARGPEFEVFVDRFIELSNEVAPRDLPGLTLIGWWGQANVDVMNYLQNAVDYHEQAFREAFQMACLVNPNSGELRVLTRKHSLEMNNSTIETEEYSVKSLLSR